MKDIPLIFLFGPPAFITWGIISFFCILFLSDNGGLAATAATIIMILVFAFNPNTTYISD